MTLWMMALMAIVLGIFLAAIPNIIWLISLIISKFCNLHISYSPFGWTALSLMLLCWSLLAYGYLFGRWNTEVIEIEYSHEDIPETFKGYRIVHISDLHLSTFEGHPDKLLKIVDTINSIEPDLICFTGDLINTTPEEALPFADILKDMKCKDGIVSVLGNHDFMLYSFHGRSASEAEAAVDSLVKIETDILGWNLLRNSNAVISRGEEKITIIGVDNENRSSQGFKSISKGDLTAASAGTDGFRILLTHDPSHWSHEVVPQTDIPLTLSGHTHAAQIRIAGWTPADLVFEQSAGRYDIDGHTLYINIGLGCTAPFRIGARPEITVITLR